jgi:hypothetical protein
LNNKLDVEIRILDGILKLLNAITTQDNHHHHSQYNLHHHGSNSQTSPNQSNDLTSIHLSQLLNTCKCLFVSHRKIAIYMNDLQKMQQRTQQSPNTTNEFDLNKNLSKIYLSNLRIPLSWKWNDFVKATKNSGMILLGFLKDRLDF